MSDYSPYRVYSLERRGILRRENTTVPPNYNRQEQGFDMNYSVANFTGEQLYLYRSDGEFLHCLPVADQRGSSVLRSQAVRINMQVCKIIQHGNKTPYSEWSSCQVELGANQFSDLPIMIDELGIIVATESNRHMVKTTSQVLDAVFDSTMRFSKDSGKSVLPMVVYANVDTDKYPNWYVSVDETIMKVPVIRCDTFPEGTGHLKIDVVEDGKSLQISLNIELDKLLADEDGVLTYARFETILEDGTPTAKYKISHSDSLLKTYLDKERDGTLHRREVINRGPDSMITVQESEQIIAARTEELRQTVRELTERVSQQNGDITAAKKALKESVATNNLMEKKIEELIEPESLNQRIDERMQAVKVAHEKTAMEQVKTKVGIATGAVGLFTLIKTPLVAAAKWIASWFGWGIVAAV